MLAVIIAVVIVALVLLLTLVIAFVASAGIALIGWVLSLIFPLSAFEGTIVSIVASLSVGSLLYQVVFKDAIASSFSDEDEGEDWDDEDEEWTPPVAHWRQQRPTRASPKPRSRKKRG